MHIQIKEMKKEDILRIREIDRSEIITSMYINKNGSLETVETNHNVPRWRAKRLYISATESESAVGFYLSYGCKLAPKVNDELYALEPNDIHMIKEL